MENVRISSGRVMVILGEPVQASGSNGKVTGYTGVDADVVGGATYKDSPYSTFQATVAGTGAVTATVTIYGSNSVDGTPYCATALGTITLNGTTTATDGFTTTAPWKYIVPVLTNLTGTGATCYVLMGV
jgi:hypothetical protein